MTSMQRILGVVSLCFYAAAATHAAAPRTGGDNAKSSPYRYTSCLVDSDGDGLADCYETNTHVYVSSTDTGTDPAVTDTDGDGLSDGDEVNGTAGGLNLPAFGVNPLHKDILLEYDWMNDSNCCGGAHSHRPTQAMADIVTNVFADAPVSNPDGTTGIHVFQDLLLGPVGNPNRASNLIPDADGLIEHGVLDDEYQAYEAQYFPANRHGYFHYVIFAHAYTDAPGSSGQATINGHEMLITLQCQFTNTTAVAYTIVHELGHNLGLRHGGDEVCNWKPNYNSVMNYRYQFSGVVGCSLNVLGKADYSLGTRRTLDESAIYEPDGVCLFGSGSGGPPPIDWNTNHVIDTVPYQRDLNGGSGCPAITVLHDYDDWGNLNMSAVHTASTQVETCAPTPPI